MLLLLFSKVGRREVPLDFSLNKNKDQETLSHPFLFMLFLYMSQQLNAEIMTQRKGKDRIGQCIQLTLELCRSTHRQIFFNEYIVEFPYPWISHLQT